MEERDFSPKHSQNHEQRSDSASQVFTERVAKEIHAALDAPLVHLGTVNKGKAFTVRYGEKAPGSLMNGYIATCLD